MRLTEHVHQALNQIVLHGDSCIDATAGNGHDTVVMAQLVGPTGQVVSIDIQQTAVDNTRARLAQTGQLDRCQLICGDHGTELAALVPALRAKIRAITFNLGYLPGADHHIITTAEATLRALEASAVLLQPQGILCVTAYRGHPGGKEEAHAVEEWMRSIRSRNWQLESYQPEVRRPERLPPLLWLAKKPDTD